MKHYYCLILILTSLFLFADDLKQAPLWYSQMPNYEGVLFGVGTGENLEQAMTSARSDLAAQKESRVIQNLVLQEYEKTQGESSFSSTELEVTTQQIVDTMLEKAIRVDMHISEDETYYVLILTPLTTDKPVSHIVSEVVDQIEAVKNQRRNRTTLSSVLLPGSGHMVQHRVPKGIALMSVALISAAGGTFSMIQANYKQEEASNQSNRALREYYDRQATDWALIGIGCYALLGADIVYASMDNYRLYK